MGDNPGQQSASAIGRASAELQQILAGLALPAQQQAAAAWLSDLGQPGEVPASVRREFAEARGRLNTDTESASARGRASIAQSALQSGMAYNPAALSDASEAFTQQLETVRQRRMRALQFAEAQTGQSQTNQLLGQLIGSGGQILGGAQGYGQGAMGAANLLSQAYQQQAQQGATYGGIAGSILGGLLGSVVPGLGTAAGAGLGGAAGGAIGGAWGGGW